MFIVNHQFSNIESLDNKNNIGICNLMKTLFSVILLNNSSIETTLISDKLYNFFNLFFDIFDNQNFINPNQNFIKNITELDIYHNYKNNKELLCVEGWRLFNKWEVKIPAFYENKSIFNETFEYSLDFKYNNIPINIKNEYLNIIINIKFKNKYINIINNFIKINNINNNFLSVHIRTWKMFGSIDDNRADNFRYNYFKNNIEKFIQNINNSKYNNIFITTDNKSEIEFILKNINKNIIFFEKENNLLDIEYDFINLLIFSKGNELIGSFISTFTEVGWWYSNCNPNIIII
jgi:hypothetical protein